MWARGEALVAALACKQTPVLGYSVAAQRASTWVPTPRAESHLCTFGQSES
jgi:hypothetical protein